MWYALLDIYGDTDAATWLLHGDLEHIAKEVIQQCKNCDPDNDLKNLTEDVTEDELGFYCEGDDYLALQKAVKAGKLREKHLQNFSFVFSGCNVDVYGLSNGYQAFKKAFEEYDGSNDDLEALQLPDDVPPEEEEAFAKELEDILFENEYFMGLPEGLHYISEAD